MPFTTTIVCPRNQAILATLTPFVLLIIFTTGTVVIHAAVLFPSQTLLFVIQEILRSPSPQLHTDVKCLPLRQSLHLSRSFRPLLGPLFPYPTIKDASLFCVKRIFVIDFSVERCLTVAPALEKERRSRCNALLSETPRPIQFHPTLARSCFRTTDHPIKCFQLFRQ